MGEQAIKSYKKVVLQMVEKEVFISYKAEEHDRAVEVRDMLESNGMTCWMAPRDIRGGSSYAAEIPVAINACKVFVLILSNKCQESSWVSRELDKAINSNKIILPYVIEKCNIRDEFSFYLSNVQRYDAYKDKENEDKKFIEEIKMILGKNVEEETEAANDVDVVPPQIKEKPEKKKKIKKVSGKKKAAFSKKHLLVGAAMLVTVIAAFVLSSVLNTVYIGEQKYKKNQEYIALRDIEIGVGETKTLASMSKLTSVNFDNCKFTISNVGEIFEGKEIHSLSIANCDLNEKQIQSIKFKNMKLTNLDISGNKQFKDLNVILPLKDTLYSLNISNTSASDISLLAEFGELYTLNADNSGITVITSLSENKKLKNVSLNDNDIVSLFKAFENSENLDNLSVSGNQLWSLAGLENCINLTTINASNNNISSIEGLKNATILRVVDLSNNRIDDISVLEKSSQYITELYLKNNLLQSIPEGVFKKLKYLTIDNNKIENLGDLSVYTELNGITASNNNIQSVQGLEKLSDVQYLDFSDNKLESFGENNSIKLAARAVVNLSGNPLVHIGISNARELTYLGLVGCKINDFEQIYKLDVNNLQIDYNKNIDWKKVFQMACSRIMLYGCPADKKVSIKEASGYKVEFLESGDKADIVKDYLPSNLK